MTNEEKCCHLSSVPGLICAFCNMKTPPSLKNICLQYVSNNVDLIAKKNLRTDRFEVNKDVLLTEDLWEQLLTNILDFDEKKKAEFISVFRDRKNTRLKRVKIKGEHVNESELGALIAHELVELDISNCKALTSRNINLLSKYGSTLQSLSVKGNFKLFSSGLWEVLDHVDEMGWFCIVHTPSLRRLIFRDIKFLHRGFYHILLATMYDLTHLDLSSCSDLGNFAYTTHLKSLTSLVLYDIEDMQDKISAICALTNLEHLDISQCNEDFGDYSNPDETLATIVESLPSLKSLDISGTNLAGTGVAVVGMENSFSDIPGLVHRVNNPLQFLGLYNTRHDSCSRYHIPAKLISGNKNEEQLLISALKFQHKPAMLLKVLKEILALFPLGESEYVGQLLNIVLESMDMHVSDTEIQCFGSAILFYIVGDAIRELSETVRTREKITTTVINAMFAHLEDRRIRWNGYITLHHFYEPDSISIIELDYYQI